jgi:putative ABC transport system permease protein
VVERNRMALRLLQAALWRKRGMVSLAILAVAIGGSVAGALLHVSREISQKLTHELRALGPNLVLLPAADAAVASGEGFLDESRARTRLRAMRLDGAPLLFATAQVGGRRVPVVGADLDAVRALHPSWKLRGGERGSLLGARLAERLGIEAGESVRGSFAGPDGPRDFETRIAAILESGSADDEAWWIPLADAQALLGLPGKASLVQSRIEDPSRADAVAAALGQDGAMRAVVLHALSSTEAELLDRTRRLMTYVTVGVLLAALLCAFGTLTDLALERRREIALLKTLGATRRDVVDQFGGESLVVGLLGGALGWWMGVVASQVIGREVFHSAISIHWDLLPVVLLVSVAVAMVAATGPIRLALQVEPAAALRGE